MGVNVKSYISKYNGMSSRERCLAVAYVDVLEMFPLIEGSEWVTSALCALVTVGMWGEYLGFSIYCISTVNSGNRLASRELLYLFIFFTFIPQGFFEICATLYLYI